MVVIHRPGGKEEELTSVSTEVQCTTHRATCDSIVSYPSTKIPMQDCVTTGHKTEGRVEH